MTKADLTKVLYERIPTTVQAARWDGTTEAWKAIVCLGADFEVPFLADRPARLLAGPGGQSGWVDVPAGTWVATDGEGDFWPIAAEQFAATYRPVTGR